MMDQGWVQSMQNADNIYIITEGGPKETDYLPTRESTTSLIWISMVYCDKTDGGKNMVFELRHYDTALLRLDAQMDTLAMEAKILWVSEEHRALLPLRQLRFPDRQPHESDCRACSTL